MIPYRIDLVSNIQQQQQQQQQFVLIQQQQQQQQLRPPTIYLTQQTSSQPVIMPFGSSSQAMQYTYTPQQYQQHQPSSMMFFPPQQQPNQIWSSSIVQSDNPFFHSVHQQTTSVPLQPPQIHPGVKRKSSCLEEQEQSLGEQKQQFPSLMSLSTQQQSKSMLSLPPPPPPVPHSLLPSQMRQPINNHGPTRWHSSNSNQTFQLESKQHKIFQKHQMICIDSILKEPGRSQRPSQIVIFLRGLPGAGKSYVSDLIKAEEEKHGASKPKIFSLDNYFLTENEKESKDVKTGKIIKTNVMEYEYDEQMEETYRKSMIKTFKKTVDDRFFPFLIVDQNNDEIRHFREMVDYAEMHQFQVYFIELHNDPVSCANRNIHNRTLTDIQAIHKCWEVLPLRYNILDIRSFLQDDAIEEIEMGDAVAEETKESDNSNNGDDDNNISTMENVSDDDNSECQVKIDRLDGLRTRSVHRSNSPSVSSADGLNEIESGDSIESLVEGQSIRSPTSSGKKRVRWADIEEKTLHTRKRAIGFVVGQTVEDWKRMSDDYDPSQKLNQYKYI